MDVITLNQANLAEWDYNCVPASLRINRSYAVKALGNISNVFMTTNAIMSHNVKKAKILQINNHWYFDSNAYQNTGAERIFDDNLSE